MPRGSIDSWLGLLESTHARAAYRDRPFREPETLVSHLVVEVALERAGRIDTSAYRAAVERLVAASTLTAPALPPHRRMELRHALDLAGVPHQLPSYGCLYRTTLPAHQVNPVFVTTPEAYILTHVIFYLADLGWRTPVDIRTPERARLGRLVERLLGMSIASGNWDLTAELILAARCLGTPAALRAAGWECIAAAQLPDGAVPGTRWQPGADGAETCYHTTLVTSLAALASA